MGDKVSNRLIYKADNEFRDYVNEHTDRPVVTGNALPLEHMLPYRLPVITRTYLGREADAFTQLLNYIFQAHALLVHDGLTDPLQYRWHGQHYYEMQAIKDHFQTFLTRFEKFADKKKRSSRSPYDAILHFYQHLFEPLTKAFSFTICIIHDVLRELYSYYIIHQLGAPLPANLPPAIKNDLRLEDITGSTIPLLIRFAKEASPENVLTFDRRKALIDDIFEMRQYFFKGWDAAKHRFTHNNLIIQIELQSATPELMIIPDYDSPQSRYECIDSILLNDQTYKSSLANSPYWFSGVFDDVLLKKTHDYLVELFARTRIGQRKARTPISESYNYTPYEIDSTDDAVELEKLDLCLSDPQETTRLFSFIKLSKFTNVMANHFECTFSSGKGSEIKIQRPGTRIMTLGRHKQDIELSPYKIKQILKRVEVSVGDFIEAFEA